VAHPGAVETIHGLFLEQWRLSLEPGGTSFEYSLSKETYPGVLENLHGKCRVTFEQSRALPEDG
jgi:hypothetical protein